MLPMQSMSAQKQPEVVRRRFGRVAGRYDLLNRVMSLGQDESWRKEAIRMLAPDAGERILDVGTGTGDISIRIANDYRGIRVVGCDLTPEMILIAKRRAGADKVAWVIADAQRLPFAPQAFDGAISGFFLRNVPEPDLVLREQGRVVRDAGQVVVLDTTPPRPGPFAPLAGFYLRHVIPLLGRLLAHNPSDYNYLQQSTVSFLSAEGIAERLEKAGFGAVEFAVRMFGTVAVLKAKRDAGKIETELSK